MNTASGETKIFFHPLILLLRYGVSPDQVMIRSTRFSSSFMVT